ncbi:MAG: thioredoxin domain-containing protein [Flavisolibacter sp.]
MHPYTNRLSKESSPYLLQHAHNPVDWYPWGEEAFEKARNEDKPVLVSIGYAACHWCHVMERESFENPEVAAIMNEHYVNIKVDREERPDVDHIYMDAIQAITGSGGWPLNVFLTPTRQPFYGGTYFPPQKAFNRPSWKDILFFVADAYKNRKAEVLEQAQNLTDHLQSSNAFGLSSPAEDVFTTASIDEAFKNVMKMADREWGGFGRAPKFPQTFTINFLLRYADIHGNKEAFDQAVLSLDQMIYGGIYDQVGGGFARYSTDTEWLAPHFEKMLYDNALLVVTLCEAYQLTGNERYKEVIEETLAFVERELMHEKGGFYSALDADSEGEEGRFYVWDLEEVRPLLGEDFELFAEYYDITAKGNWEHKNILRVKKPAGSFAKEKNIPVEELERVIAKGREKLLAERSKRVRPGLDDKVILGWNGLMNLAYSKAYAATTNLHYREVAERNMEFLLSAYTDGGGMLFHTWKNGEAKYPAFLDDYAYLISALLELGQVTGRHEYLDKANNWARVVVDQFEDAESPLFFYTHKGQTDVLVRKKEVYDGATPSGNATMALNLYQLSILFDIHEWRRRAEEMVRTLANATIKYPTSFGVWLSLFFEMISGTKEIVVLGENWENYLQNLLRIHISHKLVQAAEIPLSGYPLFDNRPKTSETRIYLCENYACRHPVNTLQEFVSLLHHKLI